MSSGMVDSVGLFKHSALAMSDLYVSPVQAAHAAPSNPYPALQATKGYVHIVVIKMETLMYYQW